MSDANVKPCITNMKEILKLQDMDVKTMHRKLMDVDEMLCLLKKMM